MWTKIGGQKSPVWSNMGGNLRQSAAQLPPVAPPYYMRVTISRGYPHHQLPLYNFLFLLHILSQYFKDSLKTLSKVPGNGGMSFFWMVIGKEVSALFEIYFQYLQVELLLVG